MKIVVVDRVEEIVNRVLEVVANPLNIREYSMYSWIFDISMEMIHAIDVFLPMRWVEYDHEEIPISMDKYFIHGRNILSMDLKYPWVPCNNYKPWQLWRRSCEGVFLELHLRMTGIQSCTYLWLVHHQKWSSWVRPLSSWAFRGVSFYFLLPGGHHLDFHSPFNLADSYPLFRRIRPTGMSDFMIAYIKDNFVPRNHEDVVNLGDYHRFAYDVSNEDSGIS